jgi:phosphoserine phosphatase RsbU/P
MPGVGNPLAWRGMHDRPLIEEAVTASMVRPADLPAPPKDAIRIVRACASTGIGSRDLACIVADDPVLTAELLRMANSAFFGGVSQVRSVARAVTVLAIAGWMTVCCTC